MIKYVKQKLILIINILVISIIPNLVHSQNSDNLYKKIDLFSEVLEVVQDEYVDEIDQS